MPVLIIGLTLFGIGGYLKGIWRGEHTPYLLAWLIRTMLCSLLFAALVAKGATLAPLALWSAQLAGCVGIVVVTLRKHGKLGRLSRVDVAAVVLASVGIGAWWLSGDPTYSVICALTADAIATVIGLQAAVREDRFESPAFWAISLLSAVLTLMVSNEASVVAALFSVANALTNIVGVYLASRRTLIATTT